jgi:DNA replication protein DnaC
MQTINLAEQKLLLFQKIMSIQNKQKLNQLFVIVDKFTENSKNDITNLSFEEWNDLFMEEKDLDEFISEYGMTLGEYRLKIYNAEKGNDYPINQFLEKLENYA